MALKIPRLSKNRHGVYYVRAIFFDAAGKRHLRQISLRTKNPAIARVLALQFNLQSLQPSEQMEMDTHKKILQNISTPLKVTTPTGEVVDFDPSNPVEREWAEKFLEERKAMPTHPPSAEWWKQSPEDIQKMRDTQALVDARYQETVRRMDAVRAASLPSPGLTLREAFDRHLEEEKRRVKSPNTVLEKRALFADFIESFGNVALNDITKLEITNRWRAIEFNRPNKKQEGKKLSPGRLEKRRGYLHKFFEWAIEAGLYWGKDNPASQKMATKAEIKASTRSWEEFTQEDIARLFAPEFAKSMKLPDWYWLPLMALFCGARVSELAELQVADFEQVDGVKCYLVRDGKTLTSKRTIPIHSQLLALGLWEYVEGLKARGATLFLPHRSKKYLSKSIGREWGVWLEKCGITNDRKVFHSFRSTVITDLHNANASHAAIKRSVGHTSPGMQGVHAVYVRGIALRNLQSAVELLNYPQVNFEAIKLDDPTFAAYFNAEEAKANDPANVAKAEKAKQHAEKRAALLARMKKLPKNG